MVSFNDKVTIGLTAQRLVNPDERRTALTLYNNDAANRIFIGSDSQVTVSNGFPIVPKTPTGFLVGLGDQPELELWAIAETAPVEVRILEQRGFDPRKVSEG